MKKCPMCERPKPDVKVRRTIPLTRDNPQQLQIVRVCAECWKKLKNSFDHSGHVKNRGDEMEERPQFFPFAL
jgi:hypothetical protein